MISKQQRRGNGGKEEGAIPESVRRTLDISLDRPSCLTDEKQPMSTSAKEGWKAAFSWHSLHPHRITSLLTVEGKTGILFPNLSVTASATIHVLKQVGLRLNDFTNVSELVTEPGLYGT